MDGQRFDRMTKMLATGTTRRRLVGAFSGSLAALLAGVGSFTRPAAAAKPCAAGQTCDSDGDCCGSDRCLHGHCVPALPPQAAPQAECPPSQACATAADCCYLGEVCLDGHCHCAGTRCGGVCTDLGRDDANCGSCGTACTAPETCGGGGEAGVCGCTDDELACAGKVCGTATNNCGDTVSCGPLSGECPSGQACDAAGQCVCTPSSCPTGCCDGDICRIDDDVACGAGGLACVACVAPDTCGGGGEAGVCGCTDTTTHCTAADCGTTITDLCGQPINCPDCVVTFLSVGSHDWIAPEGVSQATFDLLGAQGAGGISTTRGATSGGRGGRAAAVLGVSAGTTFRVFVGGQGSENVGGANGGGDGVRNDAGTWYGGGGGGASDVRLDPFDFEARLLVAGGGGGGGTGSPLGANGGSGGGESGTAGGGVGSALGGGGGTATTGGEGGAFDPFAINSPTAGEDGTFGQGGAGGSAGLPSTTGGGGGGGGGWYGGGGGGGSYPSAAAGGGGSGFITPAAPSTVAFQNGVRAGDGQVTITYRLD